MAKKFVKVGLERVSRTDLICVVCGNFRTEWAIMAEAMGGDDAVAGIHGKCIEKLHVHRARTRPVAPPGTSVVVGKEDTAK